MKATKHTYKRTGEEFNHKASIAGGVAALLEEMQAGKSERLTRYLSMSTRFHHYSLNNQLLIAIQCEAEPSHVASYNAWQKAGVDYDGLPFQVAKGAKSIRILAPRVKKAEDEEEIDRVYFVYVSVFDLSQLTEESQQRYRAAQFFQPLPDTQQEKLAALVDICHEEGIPVAFAHINQRGFTTTVGGQIAVKADMDSTSQFLTLIHELTHVLIHVRGVEWTISSDQKSATYRLQECHVEAVKYVVARYFGVESPFSSDYIQMWGGSATVLQQEVERVIGCAGQIIKKIEAKMNPATSDEAATVAA